MKSVFVDDVCNLTSLIANGLWRHLVFFDAGDHLRDFLNTCTTNNPLCHRGWRQCQNLMSYFFSRKNTISAASVRGAFLVSFVNVLILLFFFFFFFFAVYCFVLTFVCLIVCLYMPPSTEVSNAIIQLSALRNMAIAEWHEADGVNLMTFKSFSFWRRYTWSSCFSKNHTMHIANILQEHMNRNVK